MLPRRNMLTLERFEKVVDEFTTVAGGHSAYEAKYIASAQNVVGTTPLEINGPNVRGFVLSRGDTSASFTDRSVDSDVESTNRLTNWDIISRSTPSEVEDNYIEAKPYYNEENISESSIRFR